jgi:hypothetical protein
VTRYKATPTGDGGWELTSVADEPEPTGHKTLAKTAVTVVVLALVALYGCGGHGSKAATESPAPSPAAPSTRR